MSFELEKLNYIRQLKTVVKNKQIIISGLTAINDNVDIDEICTNIQINGTLTEQLGFKSKCFEKYQKEEELYLNLLECPDIEEGMFECLKCKSKKIFTVSKQVRRGDEATTVFAKCSECANTWVVN